ncbi:MAG: hypothetical protein JSV86_05585 [Gemmatimonadota bacterium]|nr:MAG: hypothetical protein JSV86_05585 [Gemmatimonadota bacterium]
MAEVNLEWEGAKLGFRCLSPEDYAKLQGNKRKVADLMADGAWHLADEIRGVGGSEALRRLRELRALDGVVVESEPVKGEVGLWRYRVVVRLPEPDGQLGLFE